MLSRSSCGGLAAAGKSVAEHDAAAASVAVTGDAGCDCVCLHVLSCAPCSISPRSPCRKPGAVWRQ